jgi:hypothetical protein
MQSSVSVTKYPLEHFVSLIEEREPFALARYGDGEWRCILGDKGQTCDGQEYCPGLADDLRRTLTRPGDYYYGLVRIAQIAEGVRIEHYSAERALNIDWCDGTVFVDASREGELYPLLKALRRSNMLLVGPCHLKGLFEASFVEVPCYNAYRAKARLMEEILDGACKRDLIAFSAGPVSKVLIHKLYPLVGDTHIMVDFGSLFDGFAGHYSRKYMRSREWQALRSLNLTGKE